MTIPGQYSLTYNPDLPRPSNFPSDDMNYGSSLIVVLGYSDARKYFGVTQLVFDYQAKTVVGIYSRGLDQLKGEYYDWTPWVKLI